MLRHVLCLCLLCSVAFGADYVWWEGEDPIATNFPRTSAFSPQTFADTRDLLSEGDWLSASGKAPQTPLFARYRVQVPRDGEYHLWTRKFWRHGPFTWRFGSQPWQTCGPDVALADQTSLRTHIGANWVYLGKVKLTQGQHIFELRLSARPGDDVVAAFDCFVLTPGIFIPNGRLKPGERWNRADEGFFPWEPAPDPFDDSAVLDLRHLNEPIAGQSGFVRRDGDRLTLGDGTPVRFWAVNVSSNAAGQDRASIDYMARKLAKLGVNLVRYHSPLMESPNGGTTDPKKLDDLHYLVSALKKQGIYTSISFYFPLWVRFNENPDFASYRQTDNKNPFALIFFDAKFQAMHRQWLQQILTTNNPYTGVPLAQDPAVAIIELVNEDSLFFWTLNRKNIPSPHWEDLETQFGRWLVQRYGSLEQAYARWGRARDPNDTDRRPAILEAWHMTRDGVRLGGPDKAKRISDQVRFFVDLQRGFYQQTIDYVRNELGSQSLIAPSNWIVSEPPMLDALERYTYTAGDVVDAHGYFQPKAEGDGAAYSVRVGHTFENLPAVRHPDRLPMQFRQVAGYPQMISEIGWTQPNRFRSDATFLTSAYASLQGVDTLCFFMLENNYVRGMTIDKFALASPSLAGTFPAAALQYRRGDVTQAEPSAVVTLNLEDLLAMRGEPQDVPALASYVGPVVRAFDRPGNMPARDLAKFIDQENRTITSLTGQVRWSHGTGVVTVNTPRSQGAAGFLSIADDIELSDVTIRCGNEFASVWVIALDDQPIAMSRKILVQAMTEDQPFEWKVDTNNRIVSLGAHPLEVRQIELTVTLKQVKNARVRVLDENGYPRGEPLSLDAGRLRLPADAVYCVIER